MPQPGKEFGTPQGQLHWVLDKRAHVLLCRVEIKDLEMGRQALPQQGIRQFNVGAEMTGLPRAAASAPSDRESPGPDMLGGEGRYSATAYGFHRVRFASAMHWW